jgi:gluconokinase
MIIIVMGVSGSGKSTIGDRLANALQWTFVDADTFHPPSNIEKMSRGIPLTDTDRAPWLHTLRDLIVRWLKDSRNVVLACSALKHAYRDMLVMDKKRVKVVYLKGTFELFRERMIRRRGHYMPEEMLESQFDILEEPVGAVIVEADNPPDIIVQKILTGLHLSRTL